MRRNASNPMHGQRISRHDAPRQYAIGGRQLSGQEMAAEKAAGVAAHVARTERHRRAIVRLLTHVARRSLGASVASPYPPTCPDNLYLRLHSAMRKGTTARRRGVGFWDRKWETERAVANRVWVEFVTESRSRIAGA